MPTYFAAATIERARVLVVTTPRTLEDIAVVRCRCVIAALWAGHPRLSDGRILDNRCAAA
jgi:hypothetical protein